MTDKAIKYLLLIRLGQELGTASPVTLAIHDLLSACIALLQ